MTTAHSLKTGIDLDDANRLLDGRDAAGVVQWAAEEFGSGLVMTSSFGAQAAVMLHLATRVVPNIPVIFIDTGYLFAETYRFADELTRRLSLNLKVFQAELSPARMEALHGRLWESEDVADLERYDRLRKVEPMQRALGELGATAWLAGLRRQQTDHRAGLRHLEFQDDIYKVHPILNWTAREVHQYLVEHDLPYHPLVEKGFISIGDTHSTRAVTAEEHERSGRFRGLKQECGLHLPQTSEENESRESSGL